MKTILLSLLLFFYCTSFAQNKGLYFAEYSDSYILVPDNPSINLSNNFTIEFWMLPTKFIAWSIILQEGKCNNNSFSYNVLVETDSSMNFVFNCDGNCNYSNTYKCDTKINPGQCLHVAISYSSAGVKIYFNGLLQPGHYTTGSYCGNLNISNEQLRIASYVFIDESLGFWYYGMLDELRIWNRVLSPTEILANFQNPLIGNETGLNLYYKFDDNIIGPGVLVTNYASATGPSLNGLTQSNNVASPNTVNACFDYTGYEENIYNHNDYSIFFTSNFSNHDIKINHDVKEVEIYNVLGENIYKVFNYKKMTAIELDLNNYQNGIYIIRIIDNEKILTKKILIN